MTSKKKRLIAFGLLTAFVLPLSIFVFFIYKTDAPITNGEVEFHVPYKHVTSEDDLTLDIYHPTSKQQGEKHPVLMYVHGGGWISGSKLTVNNNRFNQAFNELRKSGYFVISPDYTLAEHGKSPFPDCIQDIFAALKWVEENAEVYGFDMSRFGLIGESAGGHLAMVVSFSNPSDFGLDFNKPNIHYLIDVYGPSDLNELYHSAAADSIKLMIEKLPAALAKRMDISRLLFGFDAKERPEEIEKIMRDYSPINYLDTENLPVLIIHGEADEVVPVDQSYLLAKYLDSLNIDYVTHYLPGVNHAFYDATDKQKQEVQQLIVEFVLRQP